MMKNIDWPSIQAGNQLVAGLILLLLCALLSGCSATPPEYFSTNSGRPPITLLNNVPFFPQDDLQCGPASLAMALNWSGVEVSLSDLSPKVYTPGLKGSLQNSMVGATRRYERVPYPISGVEALMSEVSAGHPVIVLVNLGLSWYPKWHYAVVIGYDQNEGEMLLHSGLVAEERISFKVFNNIWKRSNYWGLLVMQPDMLPETAIEGQWLKAVAGLENAGLWQAALIGYKTAIQNWDESFVAWMGLGSSNYKLGDLSASEEAFYQATLLQPKNGMALNNLAHVLAKQNKLDEALAMAQRAVELGGDMQQTFLETLEEIETLKLNSLTQDLRSENK